MAPALQIQTSPIAPSIVPGAALSSPTLLCSEATAATYWLSFSVAGLCQRATQRESYSTQPGCFHSHELSEIHPRPAVYQSRVLTLGSTPRRVRSNVCPRKDTWVVSSSVQVLCGPGFSPLEDKCPRAGLFWCTMCVFIVSEKICQAAVRTGRQASSQLPAPSPALVRPGAGFGFGRPNTHVVVSYCSFVRSLFSEAYLPSVCLPW